MKNAKEVVQRVERHYVGEDCIFTMVPYKNAITILDQDGILFHSKQGSSLYINKYLEDERRKQFPYSNIPTHYARVGIKKLSYTNQILKFNKPYILIGDNSISECFVVKDNNEALVINYEMNSSKRSEHMTYDELLKFVSKNDSSEEEVYYVYIDGSIPMDEKYLFPNEQYIYNYIREKLKKNITDFREYQKTHTDLVSQYLRENPWFLDYFEQSIKKFDSSLIDFNIGIGDKLLLIVRMNNNSINSNITIQGLDVRFIRKDDFKVDIYDFPVTKYTLEQLKYISKINATKEPRIPLSLNPGVTREDIMEARQMIKSLKKIE